MKRAQAALEFLMTYGWAILVVLVVIGALAYFGVLNPSILLPEKCTLETGLNCRDHQIKSGTAGTGQVALRLENGKGKGIIITSININGEIISPSCMEGVKVGTTVYDGNYSGQTNCDPATDCSQCDTFPHAYFKCNPSGFNDDQVYLFNNKVGLHIPNGESTMVVLNGQDDCAIEDYSGKTKGNIEIQWYYDDSSSEFTHTLQGELLAKVES
ncbi:MAG: hypothetical protein V1735_00950 [Nanoarchaeota archaeon]